jgi:hypothetical protein
MIGLSYKKLTPSNPNITLYFSPKCHIIDVDSSERAIEKKNQFFLEMTQDDDH